MATKSMTPRQAIGTIVMLILAPLIYIAAFNALFGTTIPWTFTAWLLIFLASVLAAVILIALIVLGAVAFVANAIVGVVVIVVAFITLPIYFLWSVNTVAGTAIPLTLGTYAFTALILLGEVVLSMALKGK